MTIRSTISWSWRALLLLALGAMWLRSYYIQDGFWFNIGKPIGVTSKMGIVFIEAFIWHDPLWGYASTALTSDDYEWYGTTPFSKGVKYYWADFGYYDLHNDGDDPRGWQRTALVPYWFLTLLAAQPLLWKFVGVYRRRRARRGLCPACGDNLRAHMSGDKCPECGMTVPPPPTSGDMQHGQDRSPG